MSIVINNPSNTVADGSITTAKLADSAVTPAKLSTPLTNKNYFKNSGFSVIQGSASGTVSSAGPTGSLGYPGETEWAIIVTGNVQYAFSTANQSLTLTGGANVGVIRVLQRIESRDASLLASKQVTLSVELSNSLLTTVTWELFHPTTIADVHGTVSSPTQTLIASGTWTVTSTLARYSATVTLPTEVSNGLEVRIRVGAQTSGTWVIARPKLEEGGTATAFVCNDYATELAKCQRYFFSLPATAKGFPCPSTGGFAATYSYPFKVTMFQAPAISPTYTGVSNIAAYGTPVATVNGFSVQITGQNFTNTNWTISANCSAHIP